MPHHARLSRQFIERLKLGGRPQYRVAWDAGVNPTILSKIVTGIVRVDRHDSRVIAVGNVLGLTPEECFRSDASDVGAESSAV